MADKDKNNDDDDHDDDFDERLDHIARVVKDFLREGEAFVIKCEDDEIIVEETDDSHFQQDYPRLNGRLQSLNDQLDTGCGTIIGTLALGGVFCLGVHAGWWDDWLTPNVAEKLRTWWFYVPFLAVLFYFSGFLTDIQEKRVYRRGRAELFELMRSEGLDRDTLVPLIKGRPEFEKIARQLKLDPGPFRTE